MALLSVGREIPFNPTLIRFGNCDVVVFVPVTARESSLLPVISAKTIQ
jgi:hypothetical protein